MAKQCIVVDTSRSPFAKLRPVPIDSVLMGDGLWGSRLRQISTVTLPSQYDQLERTGVVDNFRKAAGKIPGGFRGLVFNDTDAYKWIEAASLSLVHTPDPALKARVDSLIGIVAAAQDTDGYLDTYYSFGNRDKRWTELGTNHEMYCAGHLIQAAVAHARSTGESPLLDVARRLADHVDRTFGPGRRQGTPGHPEIEMALVELYRLTGEPRYLALAGFLVDQRGRFPLTGLPAEKLVNHLPVREMSDIAGHAVRALYLMSGVTDIMLETGEPALRAALERLWTSLVARRMHVTGSAGSRYEGETFGEDFELPNRRAYCETCAAIANVMWNWRMLLATGHGRHADVMELALLNGTLSGISLDGTSYFYVNPLADRGRHRRAPWIECACCIPNLSRTLLAIPGMLFTTSDDGIQVNLYATARAEIAVRGGRVAIEETTRYPWEGTVHFGVSADVGEAFGLSFRVPAWAGSLAVSVNGKAIESRYPGRLRDRPSVMERYIGRRDPLADEGAGTLLSSPRAREPWKDRHLTRPAHLLRGERRQRRLRPLGPRGHAR